MPKLNTTGTQRMNGYFKQYDAPLQQYQPYTMLTSPGGHIAPPIFYGDIASYAPSEPVTKKKLKKRSTSGGLRRRMSKKGSISPCSTSKKKKKKSRSSHNLQMSTLSSHQIGRL
jgi:hypothetical protein